MLVAPKPIADELRARARLFLLLMRYRQYGRIWDEMVALDAMELIATAAFPLRYLASAGRAG